MNPKSEIPIIENILIDAENDAEPSAAKRQTNTWFLLLGLICIGLNLRPALSSFSTVLGMVRADLGISSLTAGLLTTLPVLSLGLFAPLAPLLARRFSSEKTIFAALLTLALGILIRSLFALSGLFIGSLIAGASIGILGVLLPGIVKRDFPAKPGLMTGIYTMALCFGAAVAAGATVPITLAFHENWRYGLAAWALPAILAVIIWLPQLRLTNQQATIRYRVSGLLRDPLAWQLTCYMGLQSSLAYIVFGWLPSILIDQGMTAINAGLALSISILIQIIGALLGPYLATRGRDQRFTLVLTMVATLIGLAGCLYAPLKTVWFWVILLGYGQGAGFSIGLTMIILRARDAHIASNLSSMVQGFGYTFAALGPLLTGLIHDMTGSWRSTGILFLVIGIATIIAGLGAGRALYVNAVITQLN